MFEGLGLPSVKSWDEMDVDLWCRLARLKAKVLRGKITEEQAQLEASLIADDEFVRRTKKLTKVINKL